MKSIIKSLIIISTMMQAQAHDAVITDVSLIGNGCSEDDSAVILSPDQRTLSLLFENFLIDSSLEGPSIVARKSCDMQISISVPSNKKIAINKIDYRGYAYLPHNTLLRFMSGHFLEVPALGIQTREYRDQIIKEGFMDEDLYLEQYVNNRLTEQACGQDVVLHVTSKLFARMNNEEIFASVDSADSGINYHIEFEDCTPIRRIQNREWQVNRRQFDPSRSRGRINRGNVQPRNTRREISRACQSEPKCRERLARRRGR